ncbi:MAG: outer membrane beta-barrel protein, partial [Bacteroidota bacterium]
SAELHSAQGSQPRLSPAGGGVGGGKVSQDQGSASSAELHLAQGSQPRLSPAGRGVGGGKVSQDQGSASSAELLLVLPFEPTPQTGKLGKEFSSLSSAETYVSLFPSISRLSILPHELPFSIRPLLPQTVEPYAKERFLRHHLGVQIGLIMNAGMGEDVLQANWLSRPQLGLHYAYAIQPKWRIHIGLNYAQQGVEQLTKSFPSRSFGFGFESETQTLTPQSLHFVEVPLLVERRFGNRHFFQFGMNGAYLAQVSSQWTTSAANSFEEAQAMSETRWGYRQGFRPWQLRPTLGYRYYLGKGCLIGLQGQAGLTKVLDGSFYEPTAPMQNLQLRATLTYDLWNF